jgi:hypothetical protein
MILSTVQRGFSSTTFKNIKLPHRHQPHRNLRLIGLRNQTHFWRALLVARRHRSSPQPPEPASEFERYALFEHGIQESDALENPLLLWKVSILKYLFYRSLTIHYRFINMNFPLSHAWPAISWLFPGPWYQSSACSRNPVISARTNAQL